MNSFWHIFQYLLPGHAAELHFSIFVAEPVHAAPPFAAGVATCLVRFLVPPPHETEQEDHPPYAPHWQSTALAYENKRGNNINIILKIYKNDNIQI